MGPDHRVAACIALAWATASMAGAQAPPAGAPPASIPERVAELKRSLGESQERLKKYEWIETTVVLMKDEEKSHSQQRCYYGADGKLQKVPVTPPPEEKKPRGIRGKIMEKKKAELTTCMKQAAELVRKYVPPDPEAIEKVKQAGNVAIAVLEPGKRIRLEFNDYLIPGDSLNVEMTLADNRLAALSISSFLEAEEDKSHDKDPLTLAVRMGTLDDGTTYAEESVLDAKAKHLKVIVSNSGYRKIDK